jgi:hypothetical protein
MRSATRVFRTLLMACMCLLVAQIASAQTPAVRIGYAPAPDATPVQVSLEVLVQAGDYLTLVVAEGWPSAPGNDAAAVMAAIDAVMAAGTYDGAPAFGPPVTIPGAMPGEIRHEYPFLGQLESHMCIGRGCIGYDRGAFSLTIVAPCPEIASSSGPYMVFIDALPDAPGNLWLKGVDLDPVTMNTTGLTREQIRDQLVTDLQAVGYDARASSIIGVSIELNTRVERISGIDGYGLTDGAPMGLGICSWMGLWVPTKTTTWGSIKAIYR